MVTEKLDGGNTMIHCGEVYARSTSEPSRDKWMAMVRKHTAWKVQEPGLYLYGEDVYAIHSIEYGPVPEDGTFFAFAIRHDDRFASFAQVESYAVDHGIQVVPVVHRGRFDSLADIQSFFDLAHSRPSVLGGDREGLVLRVAEGFPASEFTRNVCKSVRADHVQTAEHWRRRWRPIRILPARGR